MKRTITLNTFRWVHKSEEGMIHATMPRTVPNRPAPLAFYADQDQRFYRNVPSTARRMFTMATHVV